MNQSLNSNCEL